MYYIGCHGITIGFHRYFTHGSFKAKRPLRIALAVMGSLAVEGPVVRWVADHRKHHKFSDAEGDPHSPWRFGETVPALMKGLWWAHIGWMFDEEQTPQQKYAPDLIKDPAIRAISRQFVLWTTVSLADPAAGRRSGDVVLAGRADGVLLGLAGAGGAAAPRHVVDQLHLPRGRASGPSSPATGPGTCGGWRSSPAASRGTTCTTRTRPRPARRAEGPAGLQRPDHPLVREGGLGVRRALAGRVPDRLPPQGASRSRAA